MGLPDDSAVRENRRTWKDPAVRTPVGPVDVWIVAAVLCLVSVGVVMIYSATIGPANADRGDPSFYLRRELLNVALGAAALLAGLVVPLGFWRRGAKAILLVNVLLLVLVLVFGRTYGHSTRWLSIFGLPLQPSEPAKLAFIIYLARSIADKMERMKQFALGIVPHVVVLCVLMVLLLAQPDLGSCMILAALMVLMLFVAATKISYIVFFTFVAAPIAARFIATSSARMNRILAFIDPWSYRFDEGFQTVNALTTLASGGLTGLGLGAGHQSLGGFLPEAESDFVLPVVGEQLGFIGVSIVLALFAIIIVRGIVIAHRCRDPFSRFLAFGVTLLIGIQAAINSAVAVGIFPTKGLTLPFVSLGGSSMLVSMLAVGVLLKISRNVSYAAEHPSPAGEEPLAEAPA